MEPMKMALETAIFLCLIPFISVNPGLGRTDDRHFVIFIYRYIKNGVSFHIPNNEGEGVLVCGSSNIVIHVHSNYRDAARAMTGTV